MKKSYFVVTALLVLVAAGYLGISFGLRPLVEKQVLRGVQGLSISYDNRPSEASADQVEFFPFSCELVIRGLRLSGASPEGPIAYSVAEASLRVPFRMLLAFTPLRGIVLNNQGMMPIAENIALRNLTVRSPSARATVQRKEIDVLRAESDLVKQFLDARPVDTLAAVYHMGADNARSFFFSMDMPGKDGLAQLTFKEASLNGWQGGAIASISVDELQSRLNGHEGMRVNRIEITDITLPDIGLVHRLMDAAALGESDMDAAVKAAGPVMNELLAAQPPVLRQARARDLTFAVENGTVTMSATGVDWLSNAPQHTSSFIQGLAMPRSLATSVSGLALPDIKTDMTFESLALGSATYRKTLTLKAPGLADISCAFTLYDGGALSSEQALLLQTFSDLQLTVQDQGATAWLGRNISGDPAVAAQTLRAAANNSLEMTATAQNKAIREALVTFVDRPGRLEASSAKGQRIGILQLLAALNNPGSLFTLYAAPGPRTVEDQMSALAAEFAKISTPAAQRAGN